ncbi:solute carrier organic anion transporter family member 4C1 [Rhinatrema bivittatum]|uniref:solute carrier organic anion transporter family member 4C1 n=1 Tax=Rhinatrema bivittatum TaxID=194408 RepID=UPI00112894F2|nr:solute carrier organic anion transporter family member 4C1 [Rhinatrema bivittatum]
MKEGIDGDPFFAMKGGVDNPTFAPEEGGDLPAFRSSRVGDSKRPEGAPGRLPDQEFEEGPCGWGRFTPQALQWCNNPKGYLAAFSLLAIMQGTIVNGLINVGISTIEKRYDLNSSLTGVVSSSYDIAFCVLSLFVSFHGQRGHKPRWLAFSAFMIGLGAIIFSLPHFTSGLYKYGNELKETCHVSGVNGTLPICSSSTSYLSNYLYVFIFAQLLMGAGATPLYTLGTAFFDDSLPMHKSSLYIGIGYGMSVVGPAVGYVVGGQLLNIYIDFNSGQRNELTPDDVRWLGAWWIGFLLCGLLTWFLIPPFSCFPKHLPGTAKVQSEKVSQAHNNGSENIIEKEDIGKSFKDFPMALKLLLKNPVFMSLTASSCADALITTGFATFLPKFIENQFSQNSSFSATLAGGVLIPAAAIGQVVGGITVSKLKMGCRNVIKFSVIMSVVSLGLSSVFLFAKCGNDPFAGVSTLYNGTKVLGNVTAPCNENCSCLRSSYGPVCGADNVQYFSPCYAGCTSSSIEDNQKIYHNCSCVQNPKHAWSNAGDFFNSSIAREGKCPATCKNMSLFMGFFFFVVFFTFMSATPITIAILRCVPDKQRSFALGVQSLFIRLLGSVPGPILFGITIDSSCILWDIDQCERKGACWTYDNSKMALLLIAISASSKAITILFNVSAFFLYKPPPEKKVLKRQNSIIVTSASL